MKILMIAPQPFFTPRGTPLSVLHRLNTLSKLGHEIDLVTYHIGDTIPFKNVSYHRIPRIPFVKKISVGPSKIKIVVDVLIFFKALQLLVKNKYDVIHTHEEAGFFGVWFASWFRCKHLYDMHSSLPQQLTNFKFTKLNFLIKIFDYLENMTINKSDAVITICPELYNYVKSKWPGKEQQLIENVADNRIVFGEPKMTGDEIRKKYQLDSRTIILYAGTFEPYQGLDLLIESGPQVVDKFNNITFLLVGGNQTQVEGYRKKVADYHLQDYFVFTGQVTPELVPRFVEVSDILVTPRIEGNNTPLKIYSYLRSGKPIVATNHMTHTQVLNDDVSVLTDCNARSFSEGILKVIQNEQLKNKIVANAQKLAAEKYSYELYIKKLAALYSYLAAVEEKN